MKPTRSPIVALSLLAVLSCAPAPDEESTLEACCSMAVLQKQNVVVLLKGLNQKDPGTVGAPGSLDTAENVRIQRGDQGSFEFVRRNGITEIADAVADDVTVAGTGFRMSSYGGAIVVHGLQRASRYSATSQALQAIPPAGTGSGVHSPPWLVGRTDLQVPIKDAAGTQSPTQTNRDTATVGNIACFVWTDQDGGANYLVRDVSTGTTVYNGQFVATGATRTRVVALGSNFYVFWKEANAIRGGIVFSSGTTIVTWGASGAATVVAAASCLAGTEYDVQAGFGASIAIMYRIDATHHGRAFVSNALVLSGLVSDATAANQPDQAMAWFTQPDFSGSSLYYGTMNAANGARAMTIDKTTLANTSTVSCTGLVPTVTNIAGYAQPGYPVTMFVDSQFAISGVTTRQTLSAIFGSASYAVQASALGLASRVFFANGVPSLIALYNSVQASGTVAAPQDTYVVLNVPPSNNIPNDITAVMLPGKAGRIQANGLPSVVADATGRFHFLGQNAFAVDTTTGTAIRQYGLSDMTLTAGRPATVGAPLAFGGVELSPGGIVTAIDQGTASAGADTGAPQHEHAFIVKPEIPQLTEGAAASGSIAPGTRSYVVRWSWLDSASQRVTSAMSTPVAITTVNANSSVSVLIFGVNALTPRRWVQAEIFRTPMNGTGDIYYRVTPNVFVVDTQAAGLTTTFVDTASEATLAAGEPFQAGGDTAELENIGPPALNDLIEHQGRVAGVDAEQPWRIRFSKLYTPGTAVGFAEEFVAETPDSTGPIYKLMSMDGHLIAIKRDTIYVFSGDFPDNTGAGTIPSAIQLPVGVGTEQPRSVVLTDLGILFFSSLRGFWLLNRSLAVEFFGAQVESSAASQAVSGATVHPKFPEVRFTTEGGTTFVLNTYWTRQAGYPVWTTFTGQPCVHSIVHNGDWYLLTSTGKLFKEDLTRWQDGSTIGSGGFTAGATFTAKVVITDINFGGVGGLVRVWRGQLLGQWYDSHRVKVSLSLNHRTVSGQSFTFDATTDPDPYELEFRLNAIESKQTSMAVTIEDTADFQTRGFAWNAVMFQVGVKPGLYRGGVGRLMTGSN